MLEFYYRIWVDCIVRGRSQPGNRENWKIKSLILMTTAMTFNLALLMIIIQKYVFEIYFYKIALPFLPKSIANLISFLLLFVLPCLIFNLLLIFRNKRYEKLITKYPYYNGKLFVTYFTVSLGVPIILVWVYILFIQ